MNQPQFLILGAGIAGASVGHFLAPHGRCAMLERESQPGYHSTGRSAAQFIASYGPPQVRALSRASEPFFKNPPAGFAEAPLLTPRGLLTVAGPDEMHHLDEAWAVLKDISPRGRRLSAAEALAMVPALRPEKVSAAIHEPDSFDMDVHAIHQGYLRGFRRAGGSLVTDAEVVAIERAGGAWQVRTAAGATYTAPVLINAAGAWCDVIAGLAGVAPIGLVPKRRTAFTFAPPAGMDTARWPLLLAADESFYMKPDAGALLAAGERRRHHAAGRAARGAGHRAWPARHRNLDHAHAPPHAHLGRSAFVCGRWSIGGRLRCDGVGLLLVCGTGRLRYPDQRRHGRGLRGAGARSAAARAHQHVRVDGRHALTRTQGPAGLIDDQSSLSNGTPDRRAASTTACSS
jgi:glycine/D-amino acid oxidase-like deaminating enzyme